MVKVILQLYPHRPSSSAALTMVGISRMSAW